MLIIFSPENPPSFLIFASPEDFCDAFCVAGAVFGQDATSPRSRAMKSRSDAVSEVLLRVNSARTKLERTA